MLSDRDSSWIPKSVAQGALSAFGGYCLLGNPRFEIPYLNTSAPGYLVNFLVGVASSLISDGVHSFVKKDVHISRKAQDEASLLLSSVLSGFLFNAGLYVTNTNLPGDFGMVSGFAVGAGSDIASSFVVDVLY